MRGVFRVKAVGLVFASALVLVGATRLARADAGVAPDGRAVPAGGLAVAGQVSTSTGVASPGRPHPSGPATVNRAVARDVSPSLAALETAGGTPDRASASSEERGAGDRAAASAAAASARGLTAADVEQTEPGTEPAARLVASFDGLGVDFRGPQGTTRAGNPSDNGLAVGPNHIVQVDNGYGLAVYTKKGELYDTTGKVLFGPVPANDVFKGFSGDCEERNSGDVVVRYDQLADRWLIVMPMFSRNPYRADQPKPFGPEDGARESVIGVPGQPGGPAIMYQPAPRPPLNPSDTVGMRERMRERRMRERQAEEQGPQGVWAMCYAVSTTSDPLGAYYRYEFLRPYFPDYPRPAIWPDGYYVPTSTGDHRVSETIATQKHACVADRDAMLAGKPATEQCVIIENVSFLNNADIDGKALPPAGAPNIMMAAGGRQLDSIFDDSVIDVWQFHVDWKDPSKTKITGPEVVQVAPYHFLCEGQLTNCVPQPGTDRGLDSQGDKLMSRLVYRRVNGHEAILATHSIRTSSGGGGVRWYELRVNAKNRAVSLHQQGTYMSDGHYRWMASGTIDKFGNIGIGYSFGGLPYYAGQRFSGRAPGDPLGKLTFKETVLAEGGAAQTNTLRWEDYTTTATDPSDDCTVWYVGDYLKAGDTAYRTRIGAFQMPGCGQ